MDRRFRIDLNDLYNYGGHVSFMWVNRPSAPEAAAAAAGEGADSASHVFVIENRRPVPPLIDLASSEEVAAVPEHVEIGEVADGGVNSAPDIIVIDQRSPTPPLIDLASSEPAATDQEHISTEEVAHAPAEELACAEQSASAVLSGEGSTRSVAETVALEGGASNGLMGVSSGLAEHTGAGAVGGTPGSSTYTQRAEYLLARVEALERRIEMFNKRVEFLASRRENEGVTDEENSESASVRSISSDSSGGWVYPRKRRRL